MNWLFNARFFNLVENGKEITISWEQSRTFRGESGDDVVFFIFYTIDDAFFLSHYKILDVIIKPIGQAQLSQPLNLITLRLGLKEKFRKPKYIPDYIFSFPRARYFGRNMYRHFNLKYYRLSKEELSAVVKDEIFEARSILGVVLNSMHPDHLRAFVSELIAEMPEVLLNQYDNHKVLEKLKSYLDFSVINPSKQLRDAFNDLEGVIEEDKRKIIAFGDEQLPEKADIISEQVNIINSFLGEFESGLVVNNNLNRIENRYESIFRGRPLPIDLNQ